MPTPFFPLVVAAATAWVGSLFKDIDAKHVAQRQHRDNELKKAEQIYNDLSMSLDAMFHYQHNVAIYIAVRSGKGALREPVDVEEWNEYVKVYTKWKSNESRLLSEYEAYFTNDHLGRLFDMAKIFDKGASFIGATYYKQGSKNDLVQPMRDGQIERPDYERFFNLYKGLQGEIRRLIFEMNHQLSKQSVGNLKRRRR